jgi:hypothetical protein
MTVDTLPVSQRYDLRRVEVDDVMDRVQKSLQLRLLPEGAVRKRRSIGVATDRGTWVRVECRGLERLDAQGWGIEAAEVLRDVAKPEWYAGVAWFDPARRVMWRADETSYVEEEPVGKAAAAAGLPDAWWAALDGSLDALAGHRVTRLATPDCEPITQERVSSMIEKVLPHRVDSTIEEWTTAHADLNWANLTGPNLYILDFEDWGRAPRGLDAANLWRSSLTVPEVADRVYRQRRADLESRTGQIMMLFYCAEIMTWADESEPALAPAKTAVERLVRILAR